MNHHPNHPAQVAWRQVEAAERLDKIRESHNLPPDGAIPYHLLVADSLNQIQHQQGEEE